MKPRAKTTLRCLCGILLMNVCELSGGDVLEPGKPADVGMSTERLDGAVGLFEEAVRSDQIRGVVLLVARQGKVVLHEALGWRDKEQRVPMGRDTLIRTASNTKPIVAAAVQMLAEDGKLSLEDEIGRRLPAFANDKYRGVTIRHLLTHTSGLRIPASFLDPLLPKSAQNPDAPNLQLEVGRFADIGPQEPPGSTYRYSSAGYNILAALIEVASQQPLELFLSERIYQPLGVEDASSQPLPENFDRMAVVYQRLNGNWKVRFRRSDPSRTPFARGSGGSSAPRWAMPSSARCSSTEEAMGGEGS